MKRIAPFAAFGLFLLLAGHGQAQDFDYGRYENLFGEPVTVSATGKPERVSDSAVLMDVITAQDIQRSGARDIPTLLSRLAGVDVIRESAGTSDVGIGGYIQPLTSRIMVMINGRQVYFDGFGEVFWSALPVELEEIRQIEVIRGPQSALYGFNAVDGVVNIVTFDPVDDKVDMARVRLGNHALRDFAATVTQPLGDRAGIRLTAADDHVQDSGITPRTPANLSYAKDANRRMASFDAGATLDDDSRLSLEASHSDSGERMISTSVLFDARVKSDAVRAGYTVETAVGRIGATASYSDVNLPWVQSQAIGPFRMDDQTSAAQLSDLFKIGTDDSFRLALDARHDRLDAPVVTGGVTTGDLLAGSAMWEHQFSPSLSAVNAVRYDYFKLGRSGQGVFRDLFYTNEEFDRADLGTSVTSSLVESVTDDDKLRLSFSRGLKLPSLMNFGELGQYQRQYFSGQTVYFEGSPNLPSSAVYGYQAAWDHEIRDWGATARVNVFHDMTMKYLGTNTELISFRPPQFASLVSYSTGSVTNGLELNLEHKARDGWNWGGNYTYQRLHEHFDWGYRNAAPVNKANVNLGYGWGDWEADLYASYVSATKGQLITAGIPTVTSVVDIKGHTNLSPRLAWRPVENLTVELTAENLWPYRDVVTQRMETSYYLTLKIAY
jgi:iron complex outermembrane receptor protein